MYVYMYTHARINKGCTCTCNVLVLRGLRGGVPLQHVRPYTPP